MLNGIETMQRFADALKAVVLDIPGQKRSRLQALRTINALAGCGWHDAAMLDAIEQCDYDVTVDADGCSIEDGGDWLEAIEQIAAVYRDLIDCRDDMREAAAYLGISYDMMKTYASRQKRIRGVKKRGMLFTRSQLEDFKTEMRPRGRPREES